MLIRCFAYLLKSEEKNPILIVNYCCCTIERWLAFVICLDNGNIMNSWPLNGRQQKAIPLYTIALSATRTAQQFRDHYGHIKYAMKHSEVARTGIAKNNTRSRVIHYSNRGAVEILPFLLCCSMLVPCYAINSSPRRVQSSKWRRTKQIM